MSPLRSTLWYLSLTVAVLYLLGTVFGGIGLGKIALHPASPTISQSEESNAEATAQRNSVEFRDVELETQDGVSLRAWFMRPQEANGNAVILLHGVSDNRIGMYGYGRWLLQNHYSVLLPDARHHGNSGGLTTYGIKEADDIHQWVDWIETNEHPHCVYGLGESMGAAELLQSLTRESRFCIAHRFQPHRGHRKQQQIEQIFILVADDHQLCLLDLSQRWMIDNRVADPSRLNSATVLARQICIIVAQPVCTIGVPVDHLQFNTIILQVFVQMLIERDSVVLDCMPNDDYARPCIPGHLAVLPDTHQARGYIRGRCKGVVL